MARRSKNILFIMCDQLRWDYLSCAGHPTLATPNIDALAGKGVRFEDAPHLIAKLPTHELWMAFAHDTEGNLFALMSEVTQPRK